MSSFATPKIAIIGAGPAGLTLASLFTKNNIPFTVFDLRSRPSPSDINTPCGSLDLHVESGLLALQSCGLYEKFKELASGDCTEDFRLADKTGTILHEDSGSGLRPEISRNVLTQMLLDTIPSDRIRWEIKVSGVQQAEDGRRWRLNFAGPPSSSLENTSNEDFDLVVGADGAWSKIRPVLTDVRPHFSGVTCVTLTIPHLDSRFPHLAQMLGRGGYSACAHEKAVMTQRGSMSSARVYLMIVSPSSSSSTTEKSPSDSGLDGLSPSAMKKELLTEAHFGSWGEQLKELIAVGCDAEATSGQTIDVNRLFMLPPGHSWAHRQGLTLIGDAAHLMTPFAGEGVNAAMRDCFELSEAIKKAIATGVDVDAAVREYEEGMFPRAKETMELTEMLKKMPFEEDSPRAYVAFFKSHGQSAFEDK